MMTWSCLEFELTPTQYRQLAETNPLDPGFPHYFLKLPHLRQKIYGNVPELIDS